MAAVHESSERPAHAGSDGRRCDAGIDRLRNRLAADGKIAMINGSATKATQLIDDARETLAELAGVE